MINVPCPNPACARTLRMSEKFIGKKVACTYCAQPFVVEPEPPPPEQAATPGPTAPNALATSTAPMNSATLATGRSAVAPATASLSSRRAASPPPIPTAGEELEPPSGPPPLPSRPREVGAGLRVRSLLVSLLSLAVIVGSLTGIVWILRGPAGAQVQEEQPQRWAAISIESRGVRLLIVDAKHIDGNPSFVPLEMVNRDWSVAMPKPLPDAPPQEVAKLKAILADMNGLLDKYEVPREKRCVVCNDKLLRDMAEWDRKRAQEWLDSAVTEKLTLKLGVIDANLEAEYGARASIARRHRTASVYLDVGTGSTKYGYFENAINFSSFSDDLGGKRAVSEIDKLAKDQKVSVARAAEQWRPTGARAVGELSLKSPKLKNADRYYLVGGSAWATAVLTHPNAFRSAENKRDETVGMTAADIDAALELVKEHKTGDSLKQAVLAKAQAPHDALPGELDRVNNQFTPDQLVARITLLKCFADGCDFGSGKKQLIFDTRGLYSVPLGYIALEGGYEK